MNIRKVDNFGMLPIPMEIRKALDIKNGDNMEIEVQEDKVILKKYYDPVDRLQNKLSSVINYIENNLEDFDGDYLEDLHNCLKLTDEIMWGD